MLNPQLTACLLAALVESHRNGGTNEAPELHIVIEEFAQAMSGKRVESAIGVLNPGTMREEPCPMCSGELPCAHCNGTGKVQIDLAGKHVLMLKVLPADTSGIIAAPADLLNKIPMKMNRKQRRAELKRRLKDG